MNIIFTIIILLSSILLLFINPNLVLNSFITGGNQALELTTKLIVIYAVWLGLMKLVEESKLSNKISKKIQPLNNKLFGKIPNSANAYISMNITANALGMSGATTPMGILAIKELDKYENTDYAVAMFFVINATSIQLIPTSILSLRTSLNSSNPTDIIIPTILATAISTIIGILSVKIFIKKDI